MSTTTVTTFAVTATCEHASGTIKTTFTARSHEELSTLALLHDEFFAKMTSVEIAPRMPAPRIFDAELHTCPQPSADYYTEQQYDLLSVEDRTTISKTHTLMGVGNVLHYDKINYYWIHNERADEVVLRLVRHRK